MKIEEHVALAPYTTFRIGGLARYFCRIGKLDDIKTAVTFSREHRAPLLMLGGGSNMLISDSGFSGLVAKMDLRGVESQERGEKVIVTACAGEPWDELVARAVEQKLFGLENLSGIPGTVGGAPVQNIGAYGAQVADTVEWVEAFDPETSEFRTLSNRECAFGYRDSFFKHDGASLVIVRVAFALRKDGAPNLSYKDLRNRFEGKHPPSLAEVREAVLEIRRGKFPDLSRVGTAGSYFKNPVVSEEAYAQLQERFPDLPSFAEEKGNVKLPLAWIIDHGCALKNARVGGAFVSPTQALVIINDGSATADDVKSLSKKISDAVREATGVAIEPEVRVVT